MSGGFTEWPAMDLREIVAAIAAAFEDILQRQ